ncbi:hypothetical protein EIP91_003947 [Steccherinum ochraceum]|uniref:RraA-like protein n=1 Tax=Steccherinum ochraceum TaxID=92696 RepID=A0A4R0S040_9APHY|nr:hypothetical protein EIP91_003947 [Steccherinum ochraceum]
MDPNSSSEFPLALFSTCELSDALIKLGVPSGGYIPDMHMYSPGPQAGTSSSETIRLCGPAYTVQMVFSTDTTSPKLTAHFVDTVPTNTVVVVSAPSGELQLAVPSFLYLRRTPASTLLITVSLTPNFRTPINTEAKNAVWGGLMTAGAQSRGALGVVISGRCRDLSEHRAAGFPVFARGHSTVGQSPFTRPSAVDVPVVIGSGSEDVFPSTTVNPRDWIVADEDGAVCVPKGLLTKVLEVAAKGRDVDAKCLEDIRLGKGVQETFKLHRGR